jgi:hypothetical protein
LLAATTASRPIRRDGFSKKIRSQELSREGLDERPPLIRQAGTPRKLAQNHCARCDSEQSAQATLP